MAKTYVRTIVVSVISCPAQIKGTPNSEYINFLQAYDAETGQKIDCPFSISFNRANAFSLKHLVVTDEKGENGKYGTIDLNGVNTKPLVIEAVCKDVEEGETYATIKDENGDYVNLTYKASTTMIEQVKCTYDYETFMSKRQAGKTSITMAENQCKNEFGKDWRVATATPEQLAVYRMYLEVFSKM